MRKSETYKRRMMVQKIEDALWKREMANLGRWCEITMNRTGRMLEIIRTGYGPMERPERDSHEIKENGNVIAKFDNLWGVANWIYENR